MSKGAVALAALRLLPTRTVGNDDLKARIIDKHAYVDVRPRFVNHLLRLLYQLDVDSTIFKLGHNIMLFGEADAILKVLNFSSAFHRPKQLRPRSFANETLLMLNKMFPRVFYLKIFSNAPPPHRVGYFIWRCFWLVSVCTCLGRCNCKLRYESTVVRSTTIKTVISKSVTRPAALVRYIRRWFRINEFGDVYVTSTPDE